MRFCGRPLNCRISAPRQFHGWTPDAISQKPVSAISVAIMCALPQLETLRIAQRAGWPKLARWSRSRTRFSFKMGIERG